MADLEYYSDTPDTCHHVDRGDNVCIYCAQELGGVQIEAPMKSTTKVRSLWSDLSELVALPEEVRRRADEINQELNFPTHRGNQRKRVVLFCLYAAVKELKYPIEPKQLAKMLDLKATDLAAIPALEMRAAMHLRQQKPTIRLESALDILPTMAKRVGLSEENQITSLVTLASQTLEDNPKLTQLPPLHVAAGLIYYYFVMRYGDEVSVTVLSERTGVATGTLQSTYKEIVG